MPLRDRGETASGDGHQLERKRTSTFARAQQDRGGGAASPNFAVPTLSKIASGADKSARRNTRPHRRD